MKYVKLSDLEYEIMDYIWSKKGRVGFQDLKQYFIDGQKKNWPINYLSIYLHNIIKKGFLQAIRRGRNFFYEPTISRIDYQRYLINERLNDKMGNSVESIVAAFCGITDASDEELEQISQYLLNLSEQLNDSE